MENAQSLLHCECSLSATPAPNRWGDYIWRVSEERVPAGERRQQAIAAAIPLFAFSGYIGTPVSRVSGELGISQPYLFQLFPTKQALFMACIDACQDQLEQLANECADRERRAGRVVTLDALGLEYVKLIRDDVVLMFQLQAWAAARNCLEIETLCRTRMEGLIQLVTALTGAPQHDIDLFFARGALRIVRSALRMPMPESLAVEQPGQSVSSARSERVPSPIFLSAPTETD